ncbi:AraC family transcriptional regulator [Bosea caraganae]|uniref:AraC family transcriptional regulator n=1 Tax=Bosea caraganae TaxID=2763117 RepID=A0A370KXN7_9HYPH|nr:AraC family transcriptional regulator [Bosea caraganae]RDJ21128.1 AraC family transcriptional regulator [Bosea caraganae]
MGSAAQTKRKSSGDRAESCWLQVGFAQPSTFYRQFRMRYGRTPSEIRQTLLS